MRSSFGKVMHSVLDNLVLRKLEILVPFDQPSVARALTVATFTVVGAVLLRFMLGDAAQGAQFVTFFPAVILTTLLVGIFGGFATVALSTAAWWALYGPEAGANESHVSAAVVAFLILGSLLVFAVGTMRIALAQARALQSSLEERVEQRTRELQESQQEMQKIAANLEELVDSRTRELTTSRNLLGAVIDGMPDAVVLYEGNKDELRVAYANIATETFMGRARNDLIGSADHTIISPDHAAENKRVITAGRPLRVDGRLLETAVGRRCVEVRKIPFALANSQAALLTIIRDVTELKELEESLRQKQRIDALGQLTGGIAHDFNNLLAIAIGNLDLLEGGGIPPEDAKEFLEDARNACLRGAELTSRLLAFARKQTLEPVATDINELISKYVKLLSRLLGADIDLRWIPAETISNAIVDQAQLEAAITNLATNARDAMPKGGVLTITTRNEVLETSYTEDHPGLAPGEYVAVEVSDTGSGMSREVQAHAIEPFFTTKAEGHGTGLGLSMVFGFAKQSGGHVRIYSEEGQGTSVTLLLPRAEFEQTAGQVEGVEPDVVESGEVVLVVDDNASLRRMAVRQLASIGYVVLEAEDGPSALQVLEAEHRVDLLLTDIVMPGGLSGVELGREARQLRPDLKLIYMSGFPEGAFGDRVDLEQDIILLRKPFRKVELAARLRQILGKETKPR